MDPIECKILLNVAVNSDFTIMKELNTIARNVLMDAQIGIIYKNYIIYFYIQKLNINICSISPKKCVSCDNSLYLEINKLL